MRRSSSRSVQSSGSESTIRWKSSASAIVAKPSAAILESMAGASITDPAQGDFEAIVDRCGLLDRSERGKLALTGAGAVEFLNGQVTNELSDMQPGEGRYAAHLTHKGKMLGDLRILLPAGSGEGGRHELLLDTERVALQGLFDMIRRFKIGYEVELHKRTLESGLLSLIGPRAEETAGVEGLAETEHSNMAVEIDSIAALAVRTDVGLDLLCDAADTPRLIAALQARGAEQIGEQTAECLRVERGRP